ncbi:sequence orphan [Cystoisospora suis]|uniref:Sequence orphan n=1 Tax=Cystoisospora suis TaxID=483139 RepID=A0A2C6L9G7_9APIC|nr:sequence orphan [Cystoisospora suis]
MTPPRHCSEALQPPSAASACIAPSVAASTRRWVLKRGPVSCAALQQPEPGTPKEGLALPHIAPHSSLASPSPVSEKPRSSTTPSHLVTRLTVDAVAAGLASFGVSPFVTVIDRSIVRNAAGVQTLRSSLSDGFRQLFTRPVQCFAGRDFRIVFGVYAGTYLGANSAVTLGHYFNQSESKTEVLKFIAATAANMYLCIRKDIIFAKLFGRSSLPQTAGASAEPLGGAGSGVPSGTASQTVQKVVRAAPRRFPLISTLLFVCRDCLTIAASFNAPSHAARWLSACAANDGQPDEKSKAGGTLSSTEASSENESKKIVPPGKPESLSTDREVAGRRDQEGLPASSGTGKDRTSFCQPLRHRLATEKGFAHSIAQLLCPVGVQFLSTPLHLLSLDIYNRPGTSYSDRMKFVGRAYGGTVAARSARILPAFGIGGILNTKTKETLQRLAADNGLDTGDKE